MNCPTWAVNSANTCSANSATSLHMQLCEKKLWWLKVFDPTTWLMMRWQFCLAFCWQSSGRLNLYCKCYSTLSLRDSERKLYFQFASDSLLPSLGFWMWGLTKLIQPMTFYNESPNSDFQRNQALFSFLFILIPPVI